MIYRARLALSALLVCLSISPCFAGLKSYIDKPDDSYKYEIVEEHPIGGAITSVVRLASQTWNDRPWEHWMYLITPSEIQHPGKAILIIVGGRNHADGRIPKLPKRAAIIVNAAQQLGVPVAVLGQVPNQPLFGNLREDDLIAHSMTQYFVSGNDEDIALLPMVKSAVRAMDCVSDILQKHHNQLVDQFVVSGASKRGWTTYLTAAVDDRVIAAAPMVIDMLNLTEQMHKQKLVYGEGLSPQIMPYTSRGVIKQMQNQADQKLVNLIDPYAYRHLLTMPKLLLLGTNDPFWTVDAANIYFDDLPGITYLCYAANAKHGLNSGILSTLITFFKAAVSDLPLAKFDWQMHADGTTSLNWEDEKATLILWQSANPTMDYREAKWTPTPLQGKNSLTIKLDNPTEGYLAYYVQATFPSPFNIPYSLSTQITVLDAK